MKISHPMFGIAACVLTASAFTPAAFAQTSGNAKNELARGKYLVVLAGCTDCHTPGYFLGKPDPARFLAGSDVGFRVPGAGTVVGPNLTPDRETGLGNWTTTQIMTAIRGGVTPDNHVLSPVMPWSHYANLTPSDVRAIVAYLKTLPPVRNKVPGPFAADQKPTTLTWTISPPESAAAMDSSSK
jgi:mono/diheme cytochrome c family protein